MLDRPDPMVLRNVVKAYGGGDNAPVVLNGVDLTIGDGQIVAILGQSGCGKSTLLRIIAGLVPASAGEVLYRGQTVTGPMPGIAMVFQSFALFPWLTVLENVAFGLEAIGVPLAERRERALAAIEMIGLDGYENAYPKELSGGMRQRVGFARALVVDPDLLLLDEPFSALDVLTAETLRGDMMTLWTERRIPTRGIVFVSHNIPEAVEVCDRIIVMASHPGRVKADIHVTLPHPRDPESPAFKKIVDEIYGILAKGVAKAAKKAALAAREEATEAPEAVAAALAYRLPEVGVQPLLGIIDAIDYPPFNGTAELAELVEAEGLEMDDLLELVGALQLLGFAKLRGTKVVLYDEARGFHDAGIQERKRIYGQHLLANVPLIRHIRSQLVGDEDHELAEGDIVADLVEEGVNEEQAQRILDRAINWARYAELFSYDYDSGLFSLEQPEG